jgi:hypothetical protein
METQIAIPLQRARAGAAATARGSLGLRAWPLVSRALGVSSAAPPLELVTGSSGAIGPMPLAVNAAAALLLAAGAANASLAGYGWAPALFYAAIAWLLAPIATVLTLPSVKRSDRIAMVLIATIDLYLLRVIRGPIVFLGHDEYLHWVTADHIIERGRLFDVNVLFPVGPSFPGLEIVTAQIAQMSGLSVFAASAIVLAAARLLFVGCLFLIYERIAGSARVAALGCLFYMGCSTFVFFDTNFSYESLALPLLTLALLIEVVARDLPFKRAVPYVLLFALAALALAMTHHITAFALAAILGAFVAVQIVVGGVRSVSLQLAVTALISAVVPIVWSRAMGNPGEAYLGPVFEDGIGELMRMLHFGSSGRKLFTGDDGAVAPLWQQTLLIGSVLLTSLALAFGFFRTLSLARLFEWLEAAAGMRAALARANPRLVALTMLAIAYPLSIVFRLTRSGWEIGNRIGAFSYLGVAIVLAVLAAGVLQGASRSRLRAAAIGAIATLLVLAGIISSEGPRILVPSRYQVSADAASIEPMGIETARWTETWLGPQRHFVADRINSLLLSGFGRQLVATTLQQGYDAGVVLVAKTFGQNERSLLKKVGIDYLLADLRLTTALPVVGSYFDGGAADAMLGAPPQPAALLKFNAEDGVGRVFDNGYEVIYDVRAISGRR